MEALGLETMRTWYIRMQVSISGNDDVPGATATFLVTAMFLATATTI
jgi:hypothetical protein